MRTTVAMGEEARPSEDKTQCDSISDDVWEKLETKNATITSDFLHFSEENTLERPFAHLGRAPNPKR